MRCIKYSHLYQNCSLFGNLMINQQDIISDCNGEKTKADCPWYMSAYMLDSELKQYRKKLREDNEKICRY